MKSVECDPGLGEVSFDARDESMRFVATDNGDMSRVAVMDFEISSKAHSVEASFPGVVKSILTRERPKEGRNIAMTPSASGLVARFLIGPAHATSSLG